MKQMQACMRVYAMLAVLAAAAWRGSAADEPVATNIAAAPPAVVSTNTVLPPRSSNLTLKAPNVLSVKRMVGDVEKTGITLFTRVFSIDTQTGINELFNRCRMVDKEILKNGRNPVAARIEDGYASRQFRQRNGVVITNSLYFDLVAPQRMAYVAGGVMRRQDTSNIVQHVLAAADSAYKRTVTMLLMGPFMDWRAVRGRIYIVTDAKIWDTFVKSQVKPQPVQTVHTDAARREFIVYAGPEAFAYLDQAVAYAVAEAVLDEYARVITGKPQARLPLFFSAGVAGELSGLEVVQSRLGPLQLPQYTVNYRTYRVQMPKRGFMVPLSAKRLRSLDELVNTAEYPAKNEELYYFLRQSRAVAEALSSNAPLAMVNLARALAGGSEFKKEIGLAYMEMQRDVLAKPVTAAKPAVQTAETGERKYPDYERFAKYIQPFFHRLTEEYQTELLKQRKPAATPAANNAPAKPR